MHKILVQCFAVLFIFSPMLVSAESLVLTPEEFLLQKYDCINCHTNSGKNKQVGPKYLEVADKYRGEPNAVAELTLKVSEGGRGVWGRMPMPAAGGVVKQKEIETMVRFVLALKDDGKGNKRMDSIPPLLKDEY